MYMYVIHIVTGTFLNTLKFNVKDCDPTTGEPDSDQGFADEYVVSLSPFPSPSLVQEYTLCQFYFCELVRFLLLRHSTAS